MLNKKDAKMAQGLAIIGMVMLHLFCRLDNLPYNVHIFIAGTPLIYYMGLFGDLCIPVFCFCSGYAQYVLFDRNESYKKDRLKRIQRFIIHFWIVLIIFSIIGLVIQSSDLPRSFSEFMGNMFLYKLSYNGAWWFVITYIVLILLFPVIHRIVEKWNPFVVFILSGGIYIVAYICEMMIPDLFTNHVLSWIYTQTFFTGRTQLPFIVGMLFYRFKVIERLRDKIKDKKIDIIILAFIAILMVVVHSIEQSMVVAPVTGLVTLTCFHLWKKPKFIEKILLFLGKHSTNIWLTHMFFYLVLFKDFVFLVKEPVLILIFMFGICIGVSYIINFIEESMKKIIKRNL